MYTPLRTFFRFLSGLIAALFGIIVLLRLTASDPLEAAREQPGAAGAAVIEYTQSDGPFGGEATVRLQPPGKDSAPIEIQLSRPFWSRSWRKDG